MCRCPGSGVALQALTQRKVDLAFRVYQALLGGAAAGGGAAGGSQEAEVMDIDTQVRGYDGVGCHALSHVHVDVMPPLTSLSTAGASVLSCLVMCPSVWTNSSGAAKGVGREGRGAAYRP